MATLLYRTPDELQENSTGQGMRIALIQPARAGDIVSILPIAKAWHDAGDEVTVVTHPDFAAILEPCSYVTAQASATSHWDVGGSIDRAKRQGFDRVVATQVDAAVDPPPIQTRNFQLEQWSRAGVLEHFHDWPLVFDRRDAKGEADALRKHLPKTDKPILLHNLSGKSSPFPDKDGFKRWIESTFSAKYTLVDLENICFCKVHHMLALLERAAVLLSNDTLSLHLAYATMTPTVAFSRRDGGKNRPEWYFASEPRKHWIGHYSHQDARTDKARSEIAEIVLNERFKLGRLMREIPKPPPPPKVLADRVVHVFDSFMPSLSWDRDRFERARGTWRHHLGCDPNYSQLRFEWKPGMPSALDLGDKRALPYINDIFDFACESAGPDGIIIFTNSDIFLCRESINLVREALQDAECCYSPRVDVPGNQERSLGWIRSQKAHSGADLMAFRRRWWDEHKKYFPRMLIAREAWDTVFRWTFEAFNPKARLDPIIYHPTHAAEWGRMGDTTPSQRWNREQAFAWAKLNGRYATLDMAVSRWVFPNQS